MTRTMEASRVVDVHLMEGDDGNAKTVAIIGAGSLAGVSAVTLGAMSVMDRGVFAPDSVSDTSVDREGSASSKEQCEGSAFSPEGATNAFNDGAFLPKGEINDSTTAQEYIDRLFNQNGPLAQSIDPASLAAVHAVITVPSMDRKPVDASYNFTKAFNDTLVAYGGPEGLARAEEDCSAAYDAMIALGEYNPNWADRGAVVMEVTAIRGEGNVITGMQFTEDSERTATTPLSGVEVAFRDDAKDFDDFNSVLIAADGKMYVRGTSLEQGQRVNLEEGEIPQGTSQDQEDNENGGGNSGQADEEGSDGGSTCSGCGATTGGGDGGTDGGSCGGCGTGGTDGGDGGDGGSTDGGDGGDGGTDGGETTTTRPDETTTTRPDETTTTTAPTTTTTRPQTSTTKGTVPECVPTTPYVFCPGGVVGLQMEPIAAVEQAPQTSEAAFGGSLVGVAMAAGLLAAGVRRRLNSKGVK